MYSIVLLSVCKSPISTVWIRTFVGLTCALVNAGKINERFYGGETWDWRISREKLKPIKRQSLISRGRCSDYSIGSCVGHTVRFVLENN